MIAGYKHQIEKTVKNLINSSNNETKLCFIKHYNSSLDIINEEILLAVKGIESSNHVKIYEFKKNTMEEPYNPFFSWIRELYREFYCDEDIDDFLISCEVYPLHRLMIKHYIENGYFYREENIIFREIKFEKEKILQSIINILRYISKEHRIVLILNKLHLAQKSTIRLVQNIINSGINNNLSLIGIYNETFAVASYMREDWSALIKAIDSSKWVIECDADEVNTSKSIFQLDDSIHTSVNTFEPNLDNIDRYIVLANNMMLTIAMEDAVYFLNILYNKVEFDNASMDNKKRIDFLLLLAMSYAYNGEFKSAYIICQKIHDSEFLFQDIESLYFYNYILAIIRLYSAQKEAALSAISSAKLLAKTMEDNNKIVRIEMLKLMVLLDGCQDILLWDSNLVIPEQLLELAKLNNQKNHLAYAYLFGFFDTSVFESHTTNIEKQSYFNLGMNIAKEVGNLDLQILAFQRNGAIASAYGKFEDIVFYYEKCLEIMHGQNRIEDEAQIYNGIGYSCIIHGRYELANQFFLKAVNISIELENPYYIMESVYNIAINAVSVSDYEQVVRNIQLLLKMMSIVNATRIRISNKSKIYGLLIYAYIKQGKIYDAKLYFDKMRTILGHILEKSEPDINLWEDDMFLYYLIRGMLKREDGLFEEAAEMFGRGKHIWNQSHSKQVYIYCRFIEEEAMLYKLMGDLVKSDEVLKTGIAFCDKYSFSDNGEKLKKMLLNIEDNSTNNTDIEYLSDKEMKNLLNIAGLHRLKEELDSKNKTIKFFESWVELLNQDVDSVDSFIYNAMILLQNTFLLDELVYLEVDNNDVYLKYKDKSMEFNSAQAKYIVDYFKTHSKRIVISRFDKAYNYYSELMSIFSNNGVLSMVAVPFYKNEKLKSVFIAINGKHMNYTENLNIFTDENANIFRTAFSELLQAINRETIKKQLEKSSITDVLTGLYNRQGMKKYIEKIISTDFKQNIVERKKQISILYMDLDHFKYCNDNFGHDVGDMVLVEFSRILEKVVDKNDCVIRYGGDEFILILRNSSEDKSIETAKNILQELSIKKGFVDVIEKAYGEPVSIKSENILTCSIGIACGEITNVSEINRILKKADEALYDVKNNSKNNYLISSQQ